MEISLDDIKETEVSRGWVYSLLPFWKSQMEKFNRELTLLVRTSNDLSDIKYKQGYLDGYRAAVETPDTLRLGRKLTLSVKV